MFIFMLWKSHKPFCSYLWFIGMDADGLFLAIVENIPRVNKMRCRSNLNDEAELFSGKHRL